MTEPVLEIRQLAIRFIRDGAETTPVRNASLHINKGEMLALVGESGSGKSLTAHSIMRLLPPQAQISGEIYFKGENITRASDTHLRELRGHRVSMIFQEPMTSLNPLHTVEKQINETLFLHQGLSESAARARTLELLGLVGIPEPEKRLASYPHELSGGQRQRVMIAMALANNPELLIADEPTTALDVTLQEQILMLLRELQKTLGLAILLISHDLTLVRRFAQRVAVMQQGEIVEMAPTENLFSKPEHPYSQLLLSAEPDGLPVPVPSTAETLLNVSNLKVWFPRRAGFLARITDHIKAVDDISFTLRERETLGIVGESGSGKTTLALAILRLLPATGTAVFLGQELIALRQKEMRPLRRQLQIVFQDPYGSLSPRMSILDIVGEGLEVHGVPGTEREAAVIAALKAVQLDPDTRHRYPHEFSGGQRQRIAIARALVLRPRLIVLDEPTSALDRTVQKQIVELLRQLQEEFGFACLFISHDLKVVKALAHRVMVLRNGRMLECRDAHALFSTPEHEYTRALLAAAFVND
ncbi:MAG: ABC transporter ATP-binding protein [Moraxellaceae bacterium]|nr:ABC transporter ATP-binding protein [Moraxellaceae bacterium]